MSGRLRARTRGLLFSMLILGLTRPAFSGPPTSTPATRPQPLPILIERHPTLVPGTNVTACLLIRELGRQAVALAAERTGVPFVDATITPQLCVKPDGSRSVTAARTVDVQSRWYDKQPYEFYVQIGDVTFDRMSIPLEFVAGSDAVPYEQLAAELASHIDGTLSRAMIDRFGGGEPLPGGQGHLPDGVAELLLQPDLFASFRAVTLTQASIARDGESPERLAAIARGYVNLGESTRTLLGGAFDAFFARALLQAERLVIALPKDATSYWTRAYVRALIGMPAPARADLAQARSLGGETPEWAMLLEPMLNGETAALHAPDDAAHLAALASHLAMRTIEFSDINALTTEMSDRAYTADPLNVRAMLVGFDQGGLDGRRDLVERIPAAMRAGFASMRAWSDLPAGVQTALERAAAAQFAAPLQLRVWDQLDRQPSAGAEALPLAALATLTRDLAVVAAQRDMTFRVDTLGFNASDALEAWWPLIKDHPAAPIVATWGRNVPREELESLDLQDEHSSFSRFEERLRLRFNVRLHPSGDELRNRLFWHLDRTAYDIGFLLWRNRNSNSPEWVANQAKRLLAQSPNDPIAIAALIRNDWPNMKARADELIELGETQPDIALALSRTYAKEGDLKTARHVLNRAIDQAPLRELYVELAATYQSESDIDGYVQTLEGALALTAKSGLDHPLIENQIATALLVRGDLERAIPFAERAGASYAAWGLASQAEAYARAGRLEEADQIRARIVERYGQSNASRRFLAGLIYGRPAGDGVDQRFRTLVKGYESSTKPTDWSVLASFAIAQGDMATATRVTTRLAADTSKTVSQCLDLAALSLLQGKPDDARAALGVVEASKLTDSSVVQHKRIVQITRDILDGKAAPMPYTAADPVTSSTIPDLAKCTDAMMLAQACEHAGQRDAAVAWHRVAARAVEICPSRMFSIMRLRALGETIY